ncbi:hypothetical protein [Corynebacterium lubricantis]|uniref:hypothetical protein n=1 Tax=Corynebacterium lubricantis TaxID=541095 RepID=UPI00037BCA66|nr:hypothetical protein [Corynebacterium lubricantis]
MSVLATVLFLAIPSIVSWFAPPVEAEREKVVISSEQSDWAVEFPELDCYWDPYGLAGQSWWCEDIYVQGSSTMWTDDPEKTLRRQVRANSMELDGSSGVVMESGDNLMYFYMPPEGSLEKPTLAMAIRGGGEAGGNENEVLFAIADGWDIAGLTQVGADLWEGLAGTPMQESFSDHPLFQEQDSPEIPQAPGQDSDPFPGLQPWLEPAPREQEFASVKENHVSPV